MSEEKKKDDGGPAYPRPLVAVPGEGVEDGQDGMSLRDRFAIAALEGIISTSGAPYFCPTDESLHRHAAETAFAIADAMIEARKK